MKLLLLVGLLVLSANAWYVPRSPNSSRLDKDQQRQARIKMGMAIWLLFASSEDAKQERPQRTLDLYPCLVQTMFNFVNFEDRLTEQGKPVQFRLRGAECSAFLIPTINGPVHFSCTYNRDISCSSRRANGVVQLSISCRVNDVFLCIF